MRGSWYRAYSGLLRLDIRLLDLGRASVMLDLCLGLGGLPPGAEPALFLRRDGSRGMRQGLESRAASALALSKSRRVTRGKGQILGGSICILGPHCYRNYRFEGDQLPPSLLTSSTPGCLWAEMWLRFVWC